ncbi:hypothetical protein BC939DRAFT_480455 [Gamsiella multidivaricata]|uniref:uncharacterized protein n=1 Tax=Gamsiella multidivaricata TaxID=101098 RepID=UPI00221FDB34|nr:uncharacterized protein BC939DRAFT_480455 [Gamsiella multidivaricata]KAG0360668.1 hypothetical protein BGZ54_009444 [Gamsiella multidivaricata]KAI7818355.1 hypothetical protein BC939DRAFT_480455 [Gamsiella multidivaricata]
MASQWNISEQHKRVCLFPMPRIPRLGPKARDGAIYVTGALFALGWWFFIDSVIRSKNWNYDDGYKSVSVAFVDWVPGICSTLGMIVISCIDKAALRGDSFSFSSGGGASVAWKARVFLFIGFAFMAGGLAGSISVLCIKYILHNYGAIFNFWGICNVIQNASIMTSAAILWVAQSTESEYQYNLAI